MKSAVDILKVFLYNCWLMIQMIMNSKGHCTLLQPGFSGSHSLSNPFEIRRLNLKFKAATVKVDPSLASLGVEWSRTHSWILMKSSSGAVILHRRKPKVIVIFSEKIHLRGFNGNSVRERNSCEERRHLFQGNRWQDWHRTSIESCWFTLENSVSTVNPQSKDGLTFVLQGSFLRCRESGSSSVRVEWIILTQSQSQ
jgi:hypothetical protein